MGHDSHFLERVRRVSGPQTDLALGLYRNPELLRFVLSQARLPDGADRVAVALEPSPEAPLVVVERSGRFVTCLGAGMATDLPVITRPELDSLAERHEKSAARLGRAQEAADSASARLFRRLLTSGPAVCREDFQVALDLVPLLATGYGEVRADAVRTSTREIERAAARARRVLRSGRGDTTEVMRVWNSIWTLGHMTVLLRDSSRERAERLNPADLKIAVKGRMGEITATGILGPAMHALWTFGRLGRCVSRVTKEVLASDRCATHWLTSALCIGALGLRNERLRAEVRKALATRPTFSINDGTPEVLLDRVQAGLHVALDGSTRAEDLVVNVGRRMLWHTLERPGSDKGDWTCPEDIPPDIACAVFARSHAPLHADRDMVEVVPYAIAYYARAEAPMLFVPRALLPRLGLRNDPALAVAALGRTASVLCAPPAVAPATPGRNEPCSCGSGRKYKHCCIR